MNGVGNEHDDRSSETTPMRRAWPIRATFFVWRLPGYFLIAFVRLYQIMLSPILGRNCKFQPTCSNYFIQAVRKNGAVLGSLKGVWRILRCNPFNHGGYDPP